MFAASASGRTVDGDPAGFVSTEAVADFEGTAAELIAGWRAGGVDRTVRLTGADLPAQYRGEGKPFGNVIEVVQEAPVLDRLMGVHGRRP